ncbi:MAG: PEP-CTERM sorting domain-containing protein [Verrucomicrobia bacterium]|nr:PEP-CTERM sorting domain-containing protein [Verrucomicrobiota bacterium]
MTTGNTSAASQMDNFSVTMETVVVPEPGTYALITGALVFAYILRRRARA